jgi:hypothetical protein
VGTERAQRSEPAPSAARESAATDEIIEVLTGREAPKGWHGDEPLPEKQVPATRFRDATRRETKHRVKRLKGGMMRVPEILTPTFPEILAH